MLARRLSLPGGVEVGVAIPIGCLVPLVMTIAVLVGIGIVVGTIMARPAPLPERYGLVRVWDDGAPGGPKIVATQIVPLR